MKTQRKVAVHGTALKRKRMQKLKYVGYATAVVAAQVMSKGKSSPCDVILPGIHFL